MDQRFYRLLWCHFSESNLNDNLVYFIKKPFWKVTGDGNSSGLGVVGVLEANFIEPAHDKQDFERSSLFHRLEMKLKQMQLDYWRSNCELMGHMRHFTKKRNVQKDIPLDSLVELDTDVQNCPTGLGVNYLSAEAQLKITNKPTIHCITNLREELSGLPPRKGSGTSLLNETAVFRPNVELADESVEGLPVDGSRSTSIDQICEENIQLFLRRVAIIKSDKDTRYGLESIVTHDGEKFSQLSILPLLLV